MQMSQDCVSRLLSVISQHGDPQLDQAVLVLSSGDHRFDVKTAKLLFALMVNDMTQDLVSRDGIASHCALGVLRFLSRQHGIFEKSLEYWERLIIFGENDYYKPDGRGDNLAFDRGLYPGHNGPWGKG